MAAIVEKNVRLVSVEGESYEVALGVACMSELVKSMIDSKFPVGALH